ncbi:MAG: hypothetical protein UW71_C0039G0020 [Parcubacteria group bacterium GW2011_GWB1_44_7]|nr:MAG: hypothetical protein UW71_C0039G0020 [Parcubacteria group bacterium GW2011_GWB1_44_7]
MNREIIENQEREKTPEELKQVWLEACEIANKLGEKYKLEEPKELVDRIGKMSDGRESFPGSDYQVARGREVEAWAVYYRKILELADEETKRSDDEQGYWPGY